MRPAALGILCAALLAAWAPGAHGGTYGGNVVACAAANATLDVIEEEGLVQNAAERGQQLLDGLRPLASRHPPPVARAVAARAASPHSQASRAGPSQARSKPRVLAAQTAPRHRALRSR